ncbi:MAG: type II toxin-antitoxin system VapC family toxin [Candidatus Freyarchaeota archaeon]|nr:type II toxin-antitoxin system VapC family toxin [Candidatus Jordarchaeia archaeon]
MGFPKRVILDSSVIVGLLRNKAEDVKVVRELEGKAEVATTTINAFEVYYGAFKSRDSERNLVSVKGFLSTVEVLAFDEDDAELAGQVLAGLEAGGRRVDVRDLFVGCIAVNRGFSVVTHDKEHFGRIPRLHVVLPSEIV